MTDRELKKRLKKLKMVIILVITIILGLSIYTLCSKKAELSIYTSSEFANDLKIYGINEDEFVQYLSVFGYLVGNEQGEVNENSLESATYFIDTMGSVEPDVNENGQKCYDAEMVNKIISEISGAYINKNVPCEEFYVYDEDTHVYVQNKLQEEKPYCTKIEEISKDGDNIVVTYKLAFLTDSQMAEYMTGKHVEFEEQTIKATIMNNTEYEHAKYFINNILKD